MHKPSSYNNVSGTYLTHSCFGLFIPTYTRFSFLRSTTWFKTILLRCCCPVRLTLESSPYIIGDHSSCNNFDFYQPTIQLENYCPFFTNIIICTNPGVSLQKNCHECEIMFRLSFILYLIILSQFSNLRALLGSYLKMGIHSYIYIYIYKFEL